MDIDRPAVLVAPAVVAHAVATGHDLASHTDERRSVLTNPEEVGLALQPAITKGIHDHCRIHCIRAVVKVKATP